MLTVLAILAGGYAFAVLCWWLFLAIMCLKPHKSSLSLVAKVHGYPLLAIGLLMDFVLNVAVGTVLFLDVPREPLLTTRLKRYIHDEDVQWRKRVAGWICKNLLSIFDPSGDHCATLAQRAEGKGFDA